MPNTAEQIQQYTHPVLIKLWKHNSPLVVAKFPSGTIRQSSVSSYLTKNIVAVSLGIHPERVR